MKSPSALPWLGASILASLLMSACAADANKGESASSDLVTASGRYCTEPAVAGGRFLFADDCTKMVRVDLANGATTTVAAHRGFRPVLANHRLVYVQQTDGGFVVHSYATDLSTHTTATFSGALPEMGTSIRRWIATPNGQTFLGWRHDAQQRLVEILVGRLDGSGATATLSLPIEHVYAAYLWPSNDSSRVVIQLDSRAYSLTLDGKPSLRQLTAWPADATVAWGAARNTSFDSNEALITYLSNNETEAKVARVDVDADTRDDLVVAARGQWSVAFGGKLYYARPRAGELATPIQAATAIIERNLKTNQEDTLVALDATNSNALFHVTSDGQHLLFAARASAGGAARVGHVALATGAVTELGTFSEVSLESGKGHFIVRQGTKFQIRDLAGSVESTEISGPDARLYAFDPDTRNAVFTYSTNDFALHDHSSGKAVPLGVLPGFVKAYPIAGTPKWLLSQEESRAPYKAVTKIAGP